MAGTTKLLAVGAVAALLLFGACSTHDADDAQTDNKLAQVTDVPLPSGYSVDHSDTLIFGEGERLGGRLAYTINSSPDDMFEFFRREMPKAGWTEISIFRGPTSVMTYSRGSRVATIQVTGRTLFGSRVEMVIAPATGPADAPQQSGNLRPDDMQPTPVAPSPPRTDRDVTAQPLK